MSSTVRRRSRAAPRRGKSLLAAKSLFFVKAVDRTGKWQRFVHLPLEIARRIVATLKRHGFTAEIGREGRR